MPPPRPVRLHAARPIRRTDQTLFFAVPTTDNDRAFRLPTRFQQLADPVYSLEHCRGAAVGIDGTVRPRVTVITRDHPLVGQLATAHAPDHVPDGAEPIILLQMHFHLHRPRSHVIGEW